MRPVVTANSLFCVYTVMAASDEGTMTCRYDQPAAACDQPAAALDDSGSIDQPAH